MQCEMLAANRFWSQIFCVAFSTKRWLHFQQLCGHLQFGHGAYSFVFEDLKAVDDADVDTFDTKNIPLNAGASPR